MGDNVIEVCRRYRPLSNEEKRLHAEYGEMVIEYVEIAVSSGRRIYHSVVDNAGQQPFVFIRKRIQQKLEIFIITKLSRYVTHLDEVTPQIVSSMGKYDFQLDAFFMWAALRADFYLLQACYYKNAQHLLRLRLFEPNILVGGDRLDINVNALHLVALAGSEKCVEWLLERPNYCPYIIQELDSGSRAWLEISEHEIPFVTSSLRLFNDYMNELSPAHFAVLGNHKAILQLFVKYKQKIPNSCPHTCLIANSMDCLEYLLEIPEICMDHLNRNNMTVFHAAIVEGNIRALHLITKAARRRATLRPTIEWLTRHDDNERTPLHLAVECGQVQVVRYLILECNASVIAKDQFNRSPISYMLSHTEGLINSDNDVIQQRMNLSIRGCGAFLQISFRELLRCSDLMKCDFFFLKTLHEEGARGVLQHPASRAFLHMKWIRIRRFIIAQAVLYVVRVLLVSMLIFQQVREECILEKPVNHITGNESLRNNTFTNDRDTTSTSSILLNAITCVLLIANFLCTFCTLRAYKGWKMFFLHNVHCVIGFTSCIIMFITRSFQTTSGCHQWKWRFGSLSVLLEWLCVAYYILKLGLPVMAKHIAMYRVVVQEFVSFVIIPFSPLLMGFVFAFCISQPEKFQNPIIGLVKILAMASGELNLAELLQFDQNDEQFNTTMIISSLFTIFVVFCLSAILLSLVISDVQLLRDNVRNYIQIQMMGVCECYEMVERRGLPFVSKNLSDRILSILYGHERIQLTGRRTIITINRHEPHEIPPDIVEAAVKIISERENKYRNSEFTYPDPDSGNLLDFNIYVSGAPRWTYRDLRNPATRSYRV